MNTRKRCVEKKFSKMIALSQISILILEIFAISFIFSMSFGVVSGEIVYKKITVENAPTYYAIDNANSQAYSYDAIAHTWNLVSYAKYDFNNNNIFENLDSLDQSLLKVAPAPPSPAQEPTKQNIAEPSDNSADQTPENVAPPAAMNPTAEIPERTPESTAQGILASSSDVAWGELTDTEKKLLTDAGYSEATYTSFGEGGLDMNQNGKTTPGSGYVWENPTKSTDLSVRLQTAADDVSSGSALISEKNPVKIPTLGPSAKDYTMPWGGTVNFENALVGNFLEGLSYATWALTFTQLIGNFLPAEQGKTVKAIGLAASAGIMAGKTVYGAFAEFGEKGGTWGQGGTGAYTAGTVVGVLVTYLVLANTYEKTKEKSQSIDFQCLPWQAPAYFDNQQRKDQCAKCNGDALRPCSEYRCKSLGQTCKLINAGTGNESCIDGSPYDVTSPGIKPWEGILNSGYAYSDVKERPPGESQTTTSGMTITYSKSSDGCWPAYTPVTWGIVTTDTGDILQPAQCKIDLNHTTKFDDMAYYMDNNNLYIENHSQSISMPGVNNINSTLPEVQNGGEYTFYIRCRDGNANENRDEFAVRFCVDKGLDVTAPIIKATSIASGSPVQYQVDNLSINVYTNEPANCKWSRQPTDYNLMENNMSCSNDIWEMNAENLYTCTTTLTAIKDREENQFYFKCQDTSSQLNTMAESYSFTLIGTQPLDILSVGPAGTIGSSTSTTVVNLTVQTDNGYQNGESTCYYSSDNSSYIPMFQTGGNTHSQTLDLPGGDYTYYFKCVDLGGNTNYNSTSFTVFVDNFAPAVIRTYSLESLLWIGTDEKSSCSYSTTSCNFNVSAGINMPADSALILHYADWKPEQNYFIKCSDEYNNQPDPSECSFIIKPYNLPTEEA